MTQPLLTRKCAWCGRAFALSSTPGRPPRYCRRSHRQRAFEARLLALRMGLESGEAVVDAVALEALQDRIYVLESALADVEGDLRGRPPLEEYKRSFQHLYAAAAQLRGSSPEPKAVLRRSAGEAGGPEPSEDSSPPVL